MAADDCDKCDGTGWRTCDVCGGSGFVVVVRQYQLEAHSFDGSECLSCVNGEQECECGATGDDYDDAPDGHNDDAEDTD